MAKLRISIKPLFIIYLIICLYFGWTNIIFFYVMTIAIHEYAHFYVAGKLGYNINSIVFSISGAGLYGNCVFKERDDIKISIVGPLTNFILVIILLALWWMFPTSYMLTKDFLISNVSVMFFNLLPIYPLDGGRILMSILSLRGIDKNKTKKISLIVSLTFGCFFLILFIVSIFVKTNYNLLVIGMFLCINSIVSDNNKYYSKILTYKKDFNKPLEIKEFIVSTDNKFELLKYLSPHYYSIFIIKENGCVKKIEESELVSNG